MHVMVLCIYCGPGPSPYRNGHIATPGHFDPWHRGRNVRLRLFCVDHLATVRHSGSSSPGCRSLRVIDATRYARDFSQGPLPPVPIFALRAITPDGHCTCGTSCNNVGKHPAERWRDLLPGYVTELRTGGYGLATGARSGVFVVDLDVKDGKNGIEVFNGLGSIPPTRVAKTPTGGIHLYWRQPAHVNVRTSAGELGEGVDVRGDGGYIVIPPSPHRAGGHYVWLNDLPPADPPAWLLDLVVRGGPGPDPKPGPVTHIDAQSLHALGARLGRRNDPWERYIGEAIKKMSLGEAFCAVGDRDNTLWRIACVCARELPWASDESLATFAAQSLQLMGPDAPTKAIAKEKFARAKAELTAHAEQVKAELDAVLKVRRAAAWAMTGVEDDRPYHASDISHMCELEGCTPEQLHRRWVIRHRSAIYAYVAGKYLGPFNDRTDAPNALAECLALAESFLNLTKTLPDGSVIFRSLESVLRDYGTVAHDTLVDLTATRTRYDADTRTIIEAPCPPRSITPRYDRHIAEWLQVLAGPKIDLLLDWLYWVPRVDVPLVALFLYGARSTGKSLLAAGVNRLWTTRGLVALEDAMGGFNDRGMHSPLWFADERLPKDNRGKIRTEDLRELIQSRSLSLRRKYLPTASIIGSPRIMIAANSDTVFGSTAHMTQHDIDAFAERFLCIKVDPNASRFLKGIAHSHWVAGDAIAAHVAHIASTRQVIAAGRFQVRDSDDTLAKVLSVRSGARWQVLAWLTRYVLNPMPANNACKGYGLYVAAGKLYVNPSAITDNWGLYVKDPLPRSSEINQAVRALASGKDRGKCLVYVLDEQYLITWAEDNGEATADEVIRALQKDFDMKGQIVQLWQTTA